MKNICTLFIVGLGIVAGSLSAQCSPDAQFTNPGLYPNPLTSVEKGHVYNQSLTVVLPYKRDTTLSLPAPAGPTTVKAGFRSWSVDSVFGLPHGITAPNTTCNPSGCVFTVPYMENAKGCLQASGTPDTSGTFTVNIRCTGNGYIIAPMSISLITPPITAGDTLNFDDPRLNNAMIPATIKGFITQAKQVVYSTTMGVTVDRAKKIDLVDQWSFFPNPAQGRATLALNLSAPASATISLVDLTGKVVYTQQTGFLAQGNHDIMIEKPTSGLFLLKLEVNGEHQSKLVTFE